MMKLSSILASLVLTVMIAMVTANAGQKPGPGNVNRDPQIGQPFQVPYRLTDTNHFLVRVRINGKGPFNFLVDSGAPALYVATETAAKVGLKPIKGEFWTIVDRLDLEGGARLLGMKARVEDPFQLVGMNALGLPGASIDGILGFTILARFRLEIDPTRDSMTWTRLNYAPADPPVPHRKEGDGDRPPPELQVMNALGPLAKGLAFLMGKQPEEQRQPRGFLGLEWSEQLASGRKQVLVKGVLEGLPAAQAGVQPGDQIVKIGNREIEDLKEARSALSEVHPGDKVPLVIRRGSGINARELKPVLTAAEGF